MQTRLYITLSLLLFSLIGGPAVAQTDKLNAIELERTEISKEIEILNNRVLRQQDDLVDAKTSLAETEKEMTGVFEEAKNNPNDQTARAATLISMTYNRKLNRVERVEKRIVDTNERIQELEEQQQALTKQEASLKAQIAQAKQKQAELQKQAAAKPALKPAPAPIKKAAPAPKPIAKKAAAPPKPKAPPRKAGWPDIAQPHPGDIAFAKASIASAQRQLAKGDSPLLPRVIIESKKSFGSERMDYIGDDLYSVIAKAKAGNQSFKIFKKDFWINIPTGDAEYRFIYDATSLSKPNLHAIKEELLNPKTEQPDSE